MNRLDTNNAIFQLDNTAVHASKLTKDWFRTKNIEVLDWYKVSRFKPNRKYFGEFCREEYTKMNVNLKIEKL